MKEGNRVNYALVLAGGKGKIKREIKVAMVPNSSFERD